MPDTYEPSTLSPEEVEQLLQGEFGKQCSVKRFSCERANNAGDNYGSSLLSLEFDLANNGEFKTHHVIAKLVPPTKFLQEVFNVSVTFCKEINVYKVLHPELIKLQEECGVEEKNIINLIPKFYGARSSYDNEESSDVDFYAVLLLGNLKKDGYQLTDRLNGLDLKHCEIALTNLAVFHALVIALRQKKPSIFKNIISKVASHFHIGPRDVDDIQERVKFVDCLEKNIPECLPIINDIRKSIISFTENENKSMGREPFATLVHNDFWTNNMLFKYKEGSHIPDSIKFLDFQITLYCSPIRDIIFFLFSSAQNWVFQNHFDYLINTYYESLISQLKKLKCNVDLFEKSAFLEELDFFAPTQLYHILFMTSIIYAQKEEIEELSDISSKEHIMEVGGNAFGKAKVKEILKEFEKRGWIREYIEKA